MCSKTLGYRDHTHCIDKSADSRRDLVEKVVATWYGQPCSRGIRWREVQRHLLAMRDHSAQVVVLDTCEHPDFDKLVAGTFVADATAEYRQYLAAFCEQAGFPLLYYDATSLSDRDPDELFVDLIHRNRAGAESLSRRIGQDLSDLISRGVLHQPL